MWKPQRITGLGADWSLRCCFAVCAALIVSVSDVCSAQGDCPTDAASVLAAELRSHAPANSQDWAVYDGRRLSESRQFCAATLLELLAARLGELAGQSIARVPTPGLSTAGRDTLQHVSRQYGSVWGILSTKVLGDSLVVQVVTVVNYRTQPRTWSARVADYYLVPTGTGGWRIAVVREGTISDGGCRPGSPDPACTP